MNGNLSDIQRFDIPTEIMFSKQSEGHSIVSVLAVLFILIVAIFSIIIIDNVNNANKKRRTELALTKAIISDENVILDKSNIAKHISNVENNTDKYFFPVKELINTRY